MASRAAACCARWGCAVGDRADVGGVGAPPGGSVLDLVAMLLRRGRLIVGVLLGAVGVGIAYALIAPQRYTAVSTFVAEDPGDQSGLGGLATRVGLGPVLRGRVDAKFYARLIVSRSILDTVLSKRVAMAKGDSVRVRDYVMRGQRQSSEEARARLLDAISVTVDEETGIVRIAVTLRDPVGAAEVARALVSAVNRFNIGQRRSRAREARQFSESRKTEAEEALGSAEESLKTFYVTNREWHGSPRLTFEEGRLRRVVALRQELFLALAREVETARVREVNDTPVITVLDAPSPPERRSAPRRKAIVFLAALGGLALGVAVAGIQEALHGARAREPDAYRTVVEMIHRARQSLLPKSR